MASPPADGFLSRWARRKALVREGRVPEEPDGRDADGQGVTLRETFAVPSTSATPDLPARAPAPPAGLTAAAGTAPPVAAPATSRTPTPTLEDVSRLTPQSSVARFMAADVDPTVRHAALKKLFSDPHFNVMDGLDVYIDDYGRPDPLPAGMLQQMVQSRALGLFDEDKTEEGQDGDPRADTQNGDVSTAQPNPAPLAPAGQAVDPPADSDSPPHPLVPHRP